MERYCGYLQAGLRSWSHPWANLNTHILHKAYLEQIDEYYGLEDDLTITSKDLCRGEKVFDRCKFNSIVFYIISHNNFRPTINFAPTIQEIICVGCHIEIAEFEQFLWVFYNPRLSIYENTTENWLPITCLATLWGFEEVLALASRERHKIEELLSEPFRRQEIDYAYIPEDLTDRAMRLHFEDDHGA